MTIGVKIQSRIDRQKFRERSRGREGKRRKSGSSPIFVAVFFSGNLIRFGFIIIAIVV